jgi:hypothetical protein
MTSKKSQKILILTDPGAEIDDENFLKALMTAGVGRNAQVLIYTVPGEIGGDAQERLTRLREVFPEEFGASNTHANSHGTFTIDTIEHIQSGDVDVLIQIAPLMDCPLLHNLTGDTMIFMGDWDAPDRSMNGTKALDKNDHERREHAAQQRALFEENFRKIVSIPTVMARKIALPYKLIESFGPSFSTPILETAFSQLVGRPNPTLPWAPSIAQVNRNTIYNNYLTRQQRDEFNTAMKGPDDTLTLRLKVQTNLFLDKIDAPSSTSGWWTKGDGSYHQAVFEIGYMIYQITGIRYRCSEGEQGFQADWLEAPDTARSNWMALIKKHNCDLTPAYDLLAWVVLQHLNEGKAFPTIQEFKEKINTLISVHL